MSFRALVTSLSALAVVVVVSVSDASAQTPGAPAAAPPPPPPPLVQVGQPMPDFTLPYLEPAPDGGRPSSKTLSLASFKGKQSVVIAFFPAAFSPG
jgi:AhpC/TSA family